tara:strand:+ start:3774 stop:4154 length:381 start_codon:yes stop_codon:yes gene_type:complete
MNKNLNVFVESSKLNIISASLEKEINRINELVKSNLAKSPYIKIYIDQEEYALCDVKNFSIHENALILEGDFYNIYSDETLSESNLSRISFQYYKFHLNYQNIDVISYNCGKEYKNAKNLYNFKKF